MRLNLQSERSFWLLASGIFAFLIAATYFPVLFGKVPLPSGKVLPFAAWAGHTPADPLQPTADIGDLITQIYPFRAFASQAVKEGSLPLWNPQFLSGSPFLANSQSALFYPLNLLSYITPLPFAWTAAILLRMLLAAIFMTLFLRSIGGSKCGAIFAGMVFASCGFLTAWQGYPMGDAAIWLPLTCYAVQRLQKTPSPYSLALAALAIAMPFLAGHPATAAHLILTGAGLALLLWAFPEDPGQRFQIRLASNFALALLLALGLASVQIVPVVEWLGEVSGGLGRTWSALPAKQALGWVSRDILRGPNSAGISVPEGAAYVAMIGILLASVAPFHRARRYVWFFVSISVLGLSVAYGVEPVYWIASHTPVLGSLKNGRLILVASFGIAALSGLGVSVLEDADYFSFRKRIAVLGLLTAAFLAAFFLIHHLQFATAFKVEFLRRPSFSRTLLLISVVPLIWRLSGGLRGFAFPATICALAAFDAATFSHGYTGFASTPEIFPRAPVFEFVAKNNDPARFRIAGIGIPYPYNAPLMYGASSADGYEVRAPRLQHAFCLDFVDPAYDGIFFTPERVLEMKDRRLDLLNVKYFAVEANAPAFRQFSQSSRFSLVFNDGHVALFENQTVLPRAFAVSQTGMEILPQIEAQLSRLREESFDPERSVILGEKPAEPEAATEPQVEPFTSEVEMTESGINQLTFRVRTSGTAVLVVSQTYYPGWKATVDGNRVPAVPADLALTGIPLPAGVHQVRLFFQPLSFALGLALSAASAAIVASLIIAGRRSSQRIGRALRSS